MRALRIVLVVVIGTLAIVALGAYGAVPANVVAMLRLIENVRHHQVDGADVLLV